MTYKLFFCYDERIYKKDSGFQSMAKDMLIFLVSAGIACFCFLKNTSKLHPICGFTYLVGSLRLAICRPFGYQSQ